MNIPLKNRLKIVFSSILWVLTIAPPGWAQNSVIPKATPTPIPSYTVDQDETDRIIINRILSQGPSDIYRVDKIHGDDVLITVGKAVLDDKGNMGKITRLLIGEYVEVEFSTPRRRIKQLDVSQLTHLTNSYKTPQGVVFKRDDYVRTKEGALGVITMLFTNGLARVELVEGSSNGVYIIENIKNGYYKVATTAPFLPSAVGASAKLLPTSKPQSQPQKIGQAH